MDNLSVVEADQINIQLGSVWQHNNGSFYKIDSVVNSESDREEYPTMVTYHGTNGSAWAKPIEEFLNKMKPVDSSLFEYDEVTNYMKASEDERYDILHTILTQHTYSFDYIQDDNEEKLIVYKDDNGTINRLIYPLVGINAEQFKVKLINGKTLAWVRAFVLEYGVFRTMVRVL